MTPTQRPRCGPASIGGTFEAEIARTDPPIALAARVQRLHPGRTFLRKMLRTEGMVRTTTLASQATRQLHPGFVNLTFGSIDQGKWSTRALPLKWCQLNLKCAISLQRVSQISKQ